MEMRAWIGQANATLYRAWNAHDPDTILTLYADNARIVDNTSGLVIQRDAIHGYLCERLIGFPDFAVERATLLIDGSACAHTWVMRGTHTGEYEGLAPTGYRIEVHGATFSAFDERGLTVSDTNYVDVPGFFRQLGLE